MTDLTLEEKLEYSNDAFEGINAYAQLTDEQEYELAKRCAAGDEDAIRLMVNSNLGLVPHFARKLNRFHALSEDMLQEGRIGLVEAAKRFDPTKGTRFSTFARYWIYKHFLMYLSNYYENQTQGSRRMLEQKRRMDRINEDFYKEHGVAYSTEDLALALGESIERIEKIMTIPAGTYSLDAPISDSEKETTLKDILEDKSLDPVEELLRRELSQSMLQLLDKLDNRQQRVLRLRYGMEDGVCHSLSEIGDILGVSKQRAQQIKQQALNNLKKHCKGLELEEFLK